MPMPTLDELESRWHPLSQEVMRAMKEWRRQHPRATLNEIETELDVQLARRRSQMLQDTALTSPRADLPTLNEAERPRCPQCGVLLMAQGTQTRTLVTEHDQSLELTRSYATCPQCGAGLFPPG
jgi:ribosomal protein S27AE